MMGIHMIGDSHCGAGWSACRGVQTHWVGPVLCYSVGRDGLDRLDIRQYAIDDGDTVVFSFGEIDCRCHIHRYVAAGGSISAVIDPIVARYFETIALNVRALGKLIRVGVYNVVPPVEKVSIQENPEYPFSGTDAERQRYVLYFNAQLRQRCAEQGYLFVDVYDSYCNSEGFLNQRLSDGDVHIRKPKHIKRFIRQHMRGWVPQLDAI